MTSTEGRRARGLAALQSYAIVFLAALPTWLRPRVPTDEWDPRSAMGARVAPAAAAGHAGASALRLATWRRHAAVAAVLVAAGVLAVVVLVPSAQAQPGVLDSVRNQYAAVTRTWLGPLAAIGRRLFVKLAGIEFALSAILWVARRDSLDDLARRFLLKFILLSFVLMLITGAAFWLPLIPNSLALAGQRAGVMPVAAGPSEIVDIGIQFAFADIGNAAIPPSFEAIGAVFLKVIVQVLILLSFAAVAAQLLLVWVESYIALGGGVLFLGFGGFRATASYAENYLNYLVYCGVKLLIFYLIVGLGMAIVQQARATFVSNVGFDVRVAADALALTVTFALLSTVVPNSAASRIAGGAHLGIGHALREL